MTSRATHSLRLRPTPEHAIAVTRRQTPPAEVCPVEHLGSSAHFGLTAKAIREGKNLDALVGEIPGSRGHAPKIKASIAKSWGDIAGRRR